MSYLKCKLLFAVFLSAFITYCNAQVTISLSGKVIDAKTNAALPGASIFIHDINKGAVSKEDGSYQINNIPAGKY